MFLYPNIPYFHHFQHPIKKIFFEPCVNTSLKVPLKIFAVFFFGLFVLLTRVPCFLCLLRLIPCSCMLRVGFGHWGKGIGLHWLLIRSAYYGWLYALIIIKKGEGKEGAALVGWLLVCYTYI